jgi:hypothetical protein
MSKLQSKDFLNISCIVEDSKFSNLRRKIGDKVDQAMIKLGNYTLDHPVAYKRGMSALNWGGNAYGAYELYKYLHRSDDDESGEDNLANNDHDS